MSLKIVNNELAILLNINLKYLTTKTDTYNNELSYYSVEKLDFDELVEDIPENLKKLYSKGGKNCVLKVKSKCLEESQKVIGVATITLKRYEHNGSVGYYIPKMCFD